jgi:hypothetical protein
MPFRDPRETVESLHATLQKLEMSADPGEDEAAKAELKRILLHRIAELEVIKALEPSDPGATQTPAPSHLAPPVCAGADSDDAETAMPGSNPVGKLN